MPAPMLRTFHHAEFDVDRLVRAKAGASVSVCLPARNEESTVGDIVETVRRDLVDAGLVDEILVIDDHSEDATARRAAGAGARVVDASEVLPEYGEGHGKGEALWKSLFEAVGDLIVWCDADIRGFESTFVVGLLGPLLTRPDIGFVKGFYVRPEHGGVGGGRVTELVARPVLSLLFPHLTPIIQPLAGEYAGRRSVLEQLPFVQGYGVDLGLLIDTAALVGVEAMAQVDLGVRHHRNRTLDELSPQALAVLQAALSRAEPSRSRAAATLIRPGAEPRQISVAERPPLRDVPEYKARTA